MKACEFWHYLQVFNWTIKGWQGKYNTICYSKIFHSIQIQITQSRSVDPSLVVYEYVWGIYIYIYMVYIELILILAILLCGRELCGRQDAAMHLSDQWHGICDALIPAGGAPGRLTCLLTILQRFVTYNWRYRDRAIVHTCLCGVQKSYTKCDARYRVDQFGRRIQQRLRCCVYGSWWHVPSCCPTRSWCQVSGGTSCKQLLIPLW